MAWESSDRKDRLPPKREWERIRQAVFRRKGRVCLLGYKGCLIRATQIDHIKAGDDHSLANLQPVCSACHKHKSTAEGNAAKRVKYRNNKRPAEPHPGLLP